MSKIIISGVIRGAHVIYNRVEAKVNDAIAKYGEDKEVKLPNTGYFLPVIYGITGMKVEKLRRKKWFDRNLKNKDLKKGDPIVHADHGIGERQWRAGHEFLFGGRVAGTLRLEVNGVHGAEGPVENE